MTNKNNHTASIAAILAKTTADVTAGIMKELSDIKRDVAVVVFKVDEVKNDLSAHDRDHEVRIRRLESWRTLGIGGLYVVVLLIGWYLIYIKHS